MKVVYIILCLGVVLALIMAGFTALEQQKEAREKAQRDKEAQEFGTAWREKYGIDISDEYLYSQFTNILESTTAEVEFPDGSLRNVTFRTVGDELIPYLRNYKRDLVPYKKP